MYNQFESSPVRKRQSKKSNEFNSPVSMPSQVLVRAKLEMTDPGDSYEQEADAVADSIVNDGKIARSVSTGHSRRGVALPSRFGDQLASFQGQGSRLYGGLKDMMESGFGRDFSSVRLHTDDASAKMSDSISAKAFTYGNDIYFNVGQFNPFTKAGQRLVAHELAHVVQGSSKVGRKEEDGKTKEDAKWNRIVARISTYSTDFNHCHLEKGDLHPDLREKVDHKLDYSDWLAEYRKMVIRFNHISRDTINEASENKGGVPVTVVVRASLRTDPDGAYLQTDTFDGIKTPMIILHEIESISKATQLLQDINDAIGPIQNLIITGHGQSDSVAFTIDQKGQEHSLRVPSTTYSEAKNKAEDIKATKKFFQKVGKLMPEEKGRDKKIVFHSCLTSSHIGLEPNITDIAAKTVGWENKRNIIGGNANLNNKIKFSSDENDKLRVRDETSGMSRLSSDYVYYVGPGAYDATGHMRGIFYKFSSLLDKAKSLKNKKTKPGTASWKDFGLWLDSKFLLLYEKMGMPEILDPHEYVAVLELKKDLDYYRNHIVWEPTPNQEEQEEVKTIKGLFDSLDEAIPEYLKGDPSYLVYISNLVESLVRTELEKVIVRVS